MSINILLLAGSIAICSINSAKAQSQDDDPLSAFSYLPPLSEVNIMGSYQRLHYKRTTPYDSYGISLEGVFGKHLGLEAGFSAGKGNFQAGIGLIMWPLLYVAQKTYKPDPDDLGWYLVKSLYILSFLERVNYHIKLNPNLRLIPYVSLLRATYLDNDEINEIYGNKTYTFNFGGAAGMKTGLKIKDKWLLNAFCEWDMLYSKGNPSGFQAGFNLGYSIAD